MSRVFISYRRDDSKWIARALKDRLCEELGSQQVFMDVDSIEPGLDFVDVIEQAVSKVDVVLAIIGKNWLNASTGDGKRRLDNPEDFVRVEIATAIKRGIRLIPLLERGATMPSPDELPGDLRALTRRNAIEISDIAFAEDVNRLLVALQKVLELQKQRKSGTAESLGIDPNILQAAVREAAAAPAPNATPRRTAPASPAPRPVASPQPQPSPPPTQTRPAQTRTTPPPAHNRADETRSRSRISPLVALVLLIAGIGLSLYGSWLAYPAKVTELADLAGVAHLLPPPSGDNGPAAEAQAGTKAPPAEPDKERSGGDGTELVTNSDGGNEGERGGAKEDSGKTPLGDKPSKKRTPDQAAVVGNDASETPATKPDDDAPAANDTVGNALINAETKTGGSGASAANGATAIKPAELQPATTEPIATQPSTSQPPSTELVGGSETPPPRVGTSHKMGHSKPAAPVVVASKKGTLKGVVFDDANANGKRDHSEKGLQNVALLVTPPTGKPLKLITDADGNYETAVAPGEIVVSVDETTASLPKGAMLTTKSESGPLQILADKVATRNLGFQRQGLVEGVVYHDVNKNGKQDADEAGIPALKVAVMKSDGTTEKVVTDEHGLYCAMVPVGETCVALESNAPGGLQPSGPLDVAFDVPAGGKGNQDIRLQQSQGDVAITVFDDRNADGVQNQGEKGIPQIRVAIMSPKQTTEEWRRDPLFVTSGPDGKGGMDLSPGKWTFVLDSKDESLRYARPTTPTAITEVDVLANQQVKFHFGMQRRGTVEGFAFNDTNGNGTKDEDESGIANVKISIRATDGEVLDVKSDTTGKYHAEVLAGHSTIDVTDAPSPDASALATVLPTTIAVTAGRTATSHLAFRPVGALQGIVFQDLNGDGRQQQNEKGIKNVRLTIRTADGTSHTASTDATGKYALKALPVGKATFEADPKQTSLTGTKPTKGDPINVVAGVDTTAWHGFRRGVIEVSMAGKSMADYQKLLSQAKRDGVPLLLIVEFSQFSIFQSPSEGGRTILLRKGDKLTITEIDPQQRRAFIAAATKPDGTSQSVKTWIGIDFLTTPAGMQSQGGFSENGQPYDETRQQPFGGLLNNLPIPRMRRR